MGNYREHLRVPASWWLLGFITMATFASFIWAGFSLLTALVSYVVLLGGPAVALLIWGHATIMVTGGELRAGRVTMPLAQAGHVQALDEAQTRQLRGPLADPAAYMMLRPYLRLAVYVQVTGDNPARPYWLVGTRHPDALARAIDRSRPQARTGDTSVA
ncbi:MAG TPA: DUF3093 domain-containing protein [Streptosporangiaceae bacterium]|nr:DUF3093 domain-containing protein [Streptosporangiaceae bacterium]